MSKPYLSLVGAGPGDPGLITMKAVCVLREADVVLYDALVGEEILEYVPAGVERIPVGKRPGGHSYTQQEINGMIVQMAFTRGHVVRLKGGDPFIFGRANEEILTAQDAGIPWQLIPGISSALAVPATESIPLTCRGTAESLWITTGTTLSKDISADIKLAAQSSATVIILMGMAHLEKIMEIFIQLGKSECPVAIIQQGTTPAAKKVMGKVSNIVKKSCIERLTNPAVIIIGEVVRLQYRGLANFLAVTQSNHLE
ncbi:uroporphyrinogen-III C-methyltransferase [Chitinophaga caeni]|uniref:uroporphyrinogen-III C-methyltransferase n=1 Tax=Chitinophaga caeni TaxID=2029983 RepID=A0A291QT35_9BACT|nr:uroporphyrinogen-III C-methyltransferase [Chitinophaga caeni]ATL47189.1 uroporphyrinogen-III C-methyltransferase [Chitinophaga caeni]